MSNTCHEIATVKRVLSNNRVEIVIERSEACGSCAAKGACKALGGQTKDFSITLDNPLNAKKGQTVQLTLSEIAVVKASVILYLVPAVMLIVCSFLGYKMAPQFSFSKDDASIVGAVLGLGFGFLASFLLAKRAEKKKEIIPVITKIIE